APPSGRARRPGRGRFPSAPSPSPSGASSAREPNSLSPQGRVACRAETPAAGGEARAEMIRGALFAGAFVFLLIVSIPSPVRAQELDTVVDGLESTYGKMNDLKADFTQVAKNKSLGQ